MVTITALWLPILVSAVLVFLASWVLHMLLPFHRGDYQKLPNEEKVLAAMRELGVAPGNYHFPHCNDPKEMSSPEMTKKFEQGPVGLMNVMRSGPPAMGKYLGTWFVYLLVVGVFVAYIAGRHQMPGADYLAVFRLAGAAAFLGYAGGHAQESIWKGQRWGTTLRHMVDSLVYALLTAGAFGWLWPA